MNENRLIKTFALFPFLVNQITLVLKPLMTLSYRTSSLLTQLTPDLPKGLYAYVSKKCMEINKMKKLITTFRIIVLLFFCNISLIPQYFIWAVEMLKSFTFLKIYQNEHYISFLTTYEIFS
ncbi:hypothetical protein BY458DRAFT_485983 [Sporodiniella umbellata]|nr:hypothetical protein BY458DRAFT_485983 [Sporodiniella umbellata]